MIAFPKLLGCCFDGQARNAAPSLLIFGVLFLIEGLKGYFSKKFISRLFKFSTGPNDNAIRSTFIVCFLLLLIIPLIFAILGGARFIGLVTSW